MRRIVTFERVTADGYFAAADGNLDWVVPDDEVDQAAAASAPHFDTALFGNKTYTMFESFWPRVAEAASTSAPDPHSPGRQSTGLRAMASWLQAATKLVFSRTRKEVTWKNSELHRELDPRAIEALKRAPGKDILVFGSGSLVTQLTQHGLVDEYQLVVSPVLIGDGRPVLSGVAKHTRLELREAKPYPSGNLFLRYARKA